MDASGKPSAPRPRRIEIERETYSAGAKLAIWLSILAVVGMFALVYLLVARSARHAVRPPTRFSTAAPVRPKAAAKPTSAVLSEAEIEQIRKEYERPDTPDTPSRGTLRERIDKEYEAAKRRVELYLGQNRWGDAIGALEHVLDRYDDEELRLRADPELVELRRRANRAFKAKMAEASDHAAAGRFPEARKALESIIASFGRDEFTAPAKEELKLLAEREDAEAAAHYARSIAAVNAILPSWRFDDALAEARKLKFDRAQYQEALARRIERIQALLALKKKIIERIINASPRLSKRSMGVPGLPGELTIADQENLHAITDKGEEKIPWERLGPTGAARLALAAGSKDDAKHRLAVARLLMEVGHFEAAKEQLEAAKALGAQVAADEAELTACQQTPPEPKKE
ncbi:MAG TPA: hypothetical protein PLE19_11020 [Planctomycetota bacterium]|nr:hypothetical protein [Planctomycetota bacterium]HRR81522.1 hypothetical protein [Planctomycetota bacterium]HRT92974.1 hypothetical protein [Planctomycetota bacterium]